MNGYNKTADGLHSRREENADMGGTICITKKEGPCVCQAKTQTYRHETSDTSAVCIQLDQRAGNGVNIQMGKWKRTQKLYVGSMF